MINGLGFGTRFNQLVRRGLVTMASLAIVAGCSGRSSTAPVVVGAKRAALFPSDPATVAPGTPLQRTASCPGKTLPDQCGGWQGVELLATAGTGAASDSTDQHCLCQPIAFQVPASIPVTKGSAGNGDAFLQFREGGALQKCIYHGNGRFGRSDKRTGGDAYALVNCTDQSTAGSSVTADWFSLEVRRGDPTQGPTEASLRLGAPDVVNGVVQEEILYASDPRIPGAALHVPRGSAPPNQEFSFSVLPQPAVGSTIANGGDSFVTFGYAVDFHATGVDQFVFTNVPGAACPRIDLPYSPAALATFAGAGADSRVRARQITDLAGLASGASILAPTSDVTIDPVNHIVSFCVSHLSYYASMGKTYDSQLTSATLQTQPARSCTTAADCYPGEACNGSCYIDGLALSQPPTLIPGSQYVLHLIFYNSEASTGPQWDSTNVRLWPVAPGKPPVQLQTSPWLSNVPLSLPVMTVLPMSSVSFDVTLTAPTTDDAGPPDYPAARAFDLCLFNGAAPFGECFSWDPPHSMSSNGSSQASVVEICGDGIDNDGNGEIDDVNGVAAEPGKTCNNGGIGACFLTGTYVCDGLFSTKCNAAQGSPSPDICDGIDNNCDGIVDNGCPTGLSCGTSSGTPACQCPPNTAGDFYVDPVNGSDVAGGVFPTGAQFPPQCRFATLGKALSLATASGNRVLAVSDASSLPVTFAAETFPLMVASGVTLGTADATPTPANYTITADASVGTQAVALADGATLRGFTISALGNTQPGAVSLGASSTIDTVTLKSNSNGTQFPIGVDMASAGSSVVTGSLIDGFAMGIHITNGTLKVAGSIIQNSVFGGVVQNNGALTLETTSSIGNGGDGVESVYGTLTLNDGVHIDGNKGSGLYASNTTIVGNGSASAPISINSNGSAGIDMTNGTLSASYLTVDGNGLGASRYTGVHTYGSASVTLGAAADAVVECSNNGIHGVEIDGYGVSSIAHATMANNGVSGVRIDLATSSSPPAPTVTIASSTLSGNPYNGVEVASAPLANGVTSVVLDSLVVSNNGHNGVVLGESSGDVTATVKNSKIFSNTLAGVRINSTGSKVLIADDIAQNTGAGIEFVAASTLDGFSGNSVHGNGGDQITISAAQQANATYVFSNPSGTPCDANRNQIYCYASAGVGIRLSAPVSMKIDAEDVSWSNSAPAAGIDYVATGASSTIDVSNACPAVTSCP
jgi:hypothetical protein